MYLAHAFCIIASLVDLQTTQSCEEPYFSVFQTIFWGDCGIPALGSFCCFKQISFTSLCFFLNIAFLENIPLGEKMVLLLNKVSKPMILVKPSYFINNETEVQGGGGSHLSKIIWPISKRARWEVMSPDLGSVTSTGSLLIIFAHYVSGCPSWTAGSWKRRWGLKPF